MGDLPMKWRKPWGKWWTHQTKKWGWFRTRHENNIHQNPNIPWLPCGDCYALIATSMKIHTAFTRRTQRSYPISSCAKFEGLTSTSGFHMVSFFQETIQTISDWWAPSQSYDSRPPRLACHHPQSGKTQPPRLPWRMGSNWWADSREYLPLRFCSLEKHILLCRFCIRLDASILWIVNLYKIIDNDQI